MSRQKFQNLDRSIFCISVPRQTLVGDPQQQHRLAQQPGSKARRPAAAAPANAPAKVLANAPIRAQAVVEDAGQEEDKGEGGCCSVLG